MMPEPVSGQMVKEIIGAELTDQEVSALVEGYATLAIPISYKELLEFRCGRSVYLNIGVAPVGGRGIGALSADSWEVADLKVNVLDKDSAVVSGRSIVKGGKYKMPDGKTQDISGEYRWIDTYARRNGQWQVVAGASTPVMKGPAGKPTPSPAPRFRTEPSGPPTSARAY